MVYSLWELQSTVSHNFEWMSREICGFWKAKIREKSIGCKNFNFQKAPIRWGAFSLKGIFR